MNEIYIKAPAKLNLHLQVVSKRDDGFHNLRTLFTYIDLYDYLSFRETKNKIELKEVNPINDNLILKAAEILKEKTNCSKGAQISIEKNIPLQKGLGGGSSNAAATLLALNTLWGTELTQSELLNLSLELGSDVPFFVFGHSAWAEGRGEKLSKINFKEVEEEWHLLFMPKAQISTKEAFEQLPPLNSKSYSYEDYCSKGGFNTFEKWARESYEEIDKIFINLEKIGKPQLSGTGSSVFISFKNRELAEEVNKELSNCILVKSLERSPLMQIIE